VWETVGLLLFVGLPPTPLLDLTGVGGVEDGRDLPPRLARDAFGDDGEKSLSGQSESPPGTLSGARFSLLWWATVVAGRRYRIVTLAEPSSRTSVLPGGAPSGET